MKSFDGSVFLVSGASSGIGEAAAVSLQQRGAVVYGLTSSASTLASARERHPAVHWLSADVTRRSEVDTAMAAVLSEAGRLDGLVNNAGIYTFASLEASSEEMMRRQFEINVFGTVFLTQAALTALKDSRGTIVNVSSTSAHKAMPDQSIYAATKGAVESLTRAWALELARYGVRVNAISPGPTLTPGIAKIPMPREMFEAAKEQILQTVPLGRMGTPEEVAQWIVTLADPAVTWLTGQIVGIDGGLGVS
ncbi:SDR family NAD(P)-dependent oxidoreductase [Stigmatella sp. ncwal1]|uniref:SDR family NAD(P)-dependent oxidoreductase n=1 Tax=Stigmatella ashevillensis TaxID=2995309 RepID=A0ABT5DCB3_9BACT|nr:SDR family oxidoreductase [Stigmatella ashevillena]MDC0710743.1 SDR family NAD(P)-dependent oxidoreductase [Stigmatella ashevillena]